MSKIPQKTNKKPTQLRKNKRREIVKQEYIRTNGDVNCAELADKIGCDRTTIACDIESIKPVINDEILKDHAKEVVEKYSKNLLEELSQGQNLIRLAVNRSVQTKDSDGNPLDTPVLLCTEDELLSRLKTANQIKKLDAELFESWFFKKKAADELKITDGLVPKEIRDLVEEYSKE